MELTYEARKQYVKQYVDTFDIEDLTSLDIDDWLDVAYLLIKRIEEELVDLNGEDQIDEAYWVHALGLLGDTLKKREKTSELPSDWA